MRSVVVLALLTFGCATHSLPDLAPKRSLDLVHEEQGTLAWAGIRLGMRPDAFRLHRLISLHRSKMRARYSSEAT